MFKLNQIFDFFIGVLPFLVLLQAAVYTFYHERKKKESGKMILPNHTEGEKNLSARPEFDPPFIFSEEWMETGENSRTAVGVNRERTEPVIPGEMPIIAESHPLFPKEDQNRSYNQEPEIGLSALESSWKKNVISGIVWAEILGPPRSKKPWTPSGFRKEIPK